MNNCIRPILGPNKSSNAILLSMTTDRSNKPLAYYAPVGNKNWTDFNTTHLNGVPIYRSRSDVKESIDLPKISFCVDNELKYLVLKWTQESYVPSADIWSIDQVKITMINRNTTEVMPSQGDKFNGSIHKGNGSTPRVSAVCFKLDSNYQDDPCSNFTLSTDPPATNPPATTCKGFDSWDDTPINRQAFNGTTCYRGIFRGKNRFRCCTYSLYSYKEL